MFDIGWTELMVVGTIALIIVGPRDLPRILRFIGYWLGKARSAAREFQRTVDRYAKEADLDDVKRAAETPMRARSAVKNVIDPGGALTKDLADTERSIKAGLEDAAPGGGASRTNGGAGAKAAPAEPPRPPAGVAAAASPGEDEARRPAG